MFSRSSIALMLAPVAVLAAATGFACHVASEAAGNALARSQSYQRALPASDPSIASAPAGDRLIGLCGGVTMTAVEEDDFPYGCDWIEPIAR